MPDKGMYVSRLQKIKREVFLSIIEALKLHTYWSSGFHSGC